MPLPLHNSHSPDGSFTLDGDGHPHKVVATMNTGPTAAGLLEAPAQIAEESMTQRLWNWSGG